MKRKMIATPKKRNALVPLALFRKAGSHKKSNKAVRKKDKQSGYGEKVSHGTFNASFKVQVLVPRPILY